MSSEIKADLIKDKSGTKTLATLSSSAVAIGSDVSVGTYSSEVATTSGHTITLTNEVPASARIITVMLDSVSVAGTEDIVIQLGTGTSGSPSYVTSGYLGTRGYLSAGGGALEASTDGIGIKNAVGAASYVSVVITITYFGQDDIWHWTGSGTYSDATTVMTLSQGDIDLSGTLTQMQIKTTGGSAFDAGKIKVYFR